jgi:plastocyanin
MKSKILIAAGLIGLIAAACNSSQQPSNNGYQSPAAQQPAATQPQATPQTAPPDSNNNPETMNQPQVVGIDITASGFSPSSVTIHKGDYVQFTNKDTNPHWPASNPHPTHTDYPGFDALHGLAQGEVYRFQFNRTGTFGFHDHLHPATGGSITILP